MVLEKLCSVVRSVSVGVLVAWRIRDRLRLGHEESFSRRHDFRHGFLNRNEVGLRHFHLDLARYFNFYGNLNRPGHVDDHFFLAPDILEVRLFRIDLCWHVDLNFLGYRHGHFDFDGDLDLLLYFLGLVGQDCSLSGLLWCASAGRLAAATAPVTLASALLLVAWAILLGGGLTLIGQHCDACGVGLLGHLHFDDFLLELHLFHYFCERFSASGWLHHPFLDRPCPLDPLHIGTHHGLFLVDDLALVLGLLDHLLLLLLDHLRALLLMRLIRRHSLVD